MINNKLKNIITRSLKSYGSRPASNGMRKAIFGIFILSSIMFTPLTAVHADSIIPKPIVPSCNKGPLIVKTYTIDEKTKKEIPKEKNFEYPCDFSYVILLLNNIIKFLLFAVATPLAALGLIYAGFALLTSGGSSEAKTKAKNIVKNIIIGYLIALAAWLIVNTIFKTFDFKGKTYLNPTATEVIKINR